MRRLYLIFALAGALFPYAQLLPWLNANGLNVPLLVSELFANRIGAFFGIDVLVSALVLLAFIWSDGRRSKIPMLWLPTLATCLIGVSCGLPLFLYLRERRLEAAG